MTPNRGAFCQITLTSCRYNLGVGEQVRELGATTAVISALVVKQEDDCTTVLIISLLKISLEDDDHESISFQRSLCVGCSKMVSVIYIVGLTVCLCGYLKV